MGINYVSIPKFQRCSRWSLGMDKYFHPTLYWSWLIIHAGIQLIHVSEKGSVNLASMACGMDELQWRHNERDGVSNHQRLNCLLIHLLRRKWKQTPKPRVTGLCERNSLVTGEFPSQRASNTENVSIKWHHHFVVATLQMERCLSNYILWVGSRYKTISKTCHCKQHSKGQRPLVGL